MKIFVSSTYEDLVAHRQVVEASLSISGISYNAMEHFGSSSNPPLETCLGAVDASDVFVGILGVRYGSCPPGCVTSFTEREYKHARQLHKTILMFLIDERNATIAPCHMASENPAQLERLRLFKNNVRQNHTISLFRTPEDLARLLLASIIKECGVIT